MCSQTVILFFPVAEKRFFKDAVRFDSQLFRAVFAEWESGGIRIPAHVVIHDAGNLQIDDGIVSIDDVVHPVEADVPPSLFDRRTSANGPGHVVECVDCSRSGVAEQILDASGDVVELISGMNHQIAVEVGGAHDTRSGADSRQIAFEAVLMNEHIGLSAINFDPVIVCAEEHIAVNIGIPVESAGRGSVGASADSVVPSALTASDEVVVTDDGIAAGICNAHRHRSAGV